MARAGKQLKAAPAAGVQQTTQNVPEWLRPYVEEFGLVGRFLSGDKSVTGEQIRVAFAAKLGADGGKHRGPIDGAVNQLVVLHSKPSSIFGLVFGDNDGAWRAKKAEQAIVCSQEAECPMRGWNKKAAQAVIWAWEAKHDAETASGSSNVDETNLLALLSLPTGPPAQVRFPEFYEWAHSESYDRPQPRPPVDNGAIDAGMDIARLQSRIAEMEAELATVLVAKDYDKAAPLDAKIAELNEQLAALESKGKDSVYKLEVVAQSTLQEQIAALEAEESKAAAAKDWKGAGMAAAAITTLRAQLETETAAKAKEQTAPTAAAPTTSKGGNGKLTLPQAIAVCKAPEATNRQKKLFERYRDDDGATFGEDEFVATVEALL